MSIKSETYFLYREIFPYFKLFGEGTKRTGSMLFIFALEPNLTSILECAQFQKSYTLSDFYEISDLFIYYIYLIFFFENFVGFLGRLYGMDVYDTCSNLIQFGPNRRIRTDRQMDLARFNLHWILSNETWALKPD